MRFIDGLKSLSKKRLLIIILTLFIISWVLILLGTTIITIPFFVYFVRVFVGVLTGYTFVVMILSFFIPIDKMGSKTLIITGLLTIPVLIIFSVFVGIFYYFCRFANILFIAFFAYKWCIDTSIKFDNYLYQKDSKVFLRILEFSIILAISMYILFITIRAFRTLSLTIPAVSIVANVFIIIFLIDLILLLFILLRLVLIQKFSAYVPLFMFFTYFYVLYVVIDLFAELLFTGAGVNSYEYISFIIDLVMFIYIVGSIFDRVDYIKDKIKIFRVDTIALFVILMKMLVKLIEILQDFTVAPDPASQVGQAIIVLFYFGFFALFLGIYSIITHKDGKSLG
jgi:hypothetical protein